jgi:hypothetical protein
MSATAEAAYETRFGRAIERGGSGVGAGAAAPGRTAERSAAPAATIPPKTGEPKSEAALRGAPLSSPQLTPPPPPPPWKGVRGFFSADLPGVRPRSAEDGTGRSGIGCAPIASGVGEEAPGKAMASRRVEGGTIGGSAGGGGGGEAAGAALGRAASALDAFAIAADTSLACATGSRMSAGGGGRAAAGGAAAAAPAPAPAPLPPAAPSARYASSTWRTGDGKNFTAAARAASLDVTFGVGAVGPCVAGGRAGTRVGSTTVSLPAPAWRGDGRVFIAYRDGEIDEPRNGEVGGGEARERDDEGRFLWQKGGRDGRWPPMRVASRPPTRTHHSARHLARELRDCARTEETRKG